MRHSPEFRDHVIEGLARDLNLGRHGFVGVPTAIKLMLRDEMWKERVLPRTGETIAFDRFDTFVKASPPKGLGSDLAMVKRICADDPEAIDLIDRVTQKHVGRPVIKKDNVHSYDRPAGNTSQRALRKLRADRPDLHAQVLAKALSPHAAMVEAGFRRKTATVPVDDPDKVASFLAKHFDAAEIRKIVDLAIQLHEGNRR